MAIFKRPSGRYAVMIDAEDALPWRIVEPQPPTKAGARRAKTIAKFRTRNEAERNLAARMRAGSASDLRIERLARGRRTIGTFTTKREAEQAERAALTSQDRGVDIDPTRATMNELIALFLASREANGASGTTLYGYGRYWSLYGESLGSTPARKLSKLQLVTAYAEMRRAGGREGKPLSGKTVRHMHGLIHAALAWAVRIEMIERNVADTLGDGDLPRVERREAKAHEPAAIAHLLEDAKDAWEWPLIALAVSAGMRRGELAALRWADVDFDERTLVVRNAFAEIPGKVWMKDPKGHDVRRIDLPELAIEALRRQRATQAQEKLVAGGRYRDEGYVFAPATGGHYIPNSLYKAFARAARRAGLSLTKLHAARHSYASWLISSGVDIATVSKLLGHSEISTTLRTYAHSIEGAGKAAVIKIDEQIAKAREAAAGANGTRTAREGSKSGEKPL